MKQQDHDLLDIVVRGAGKNGSSRRELVCSCGRTFTSSQLMFAGAVEGALAAFLEHRRGVQIREGDLVIVVDLGHRRFDEIGTLRILGDVTAFVDFVTCSSDPQNPALNELLQRSQIAPYTPPGVDWSAEVAVSGQ